MNGLNYHWFPQNQVELNENKQYMQQYNKEFYGVDA